MTGGRRWYKVDLHVHSLKIGTTKSRMSPTWIGCARWETSIVAVTDHNTVAGWGHSPELEMVGPVEDKAA
jgi:predicted metal-dependent phosphoesterase TrpH